MGSIFEGWFEVIDKRGRDKNLKQRGSKVEKIKKELWKRQKCILKHLSKKGYMEKLIFM